MLVRIFCQNKFHIFVCKAFFQLKCLCTALMRFGDIFVVNLTLKLISWFYIEFMCQICGWRLGCLCMTLPDQRKLQVFIIGFLKAVRVKKLHALELSRNLLPLKHIYIICMPEHMWHVFRGLQETWLVAHINCIKYLRILTKKFASKYLHHYYNNDIILTYIRHIVIENIVHSRSGTLIKYNHSTPQKSIYN